MKTDETGARAPWRAAAGPLAATGAALAALLAVDHALGYSLLGGELDQGQRDFRIWNNFTVPSANDNQTPDPRFPGHQGAVMAIWKGCVEWQSELHGDGNGDPHQPGGLGSGGANFDPSFQGENVDDGGTNGNTHSQISGCNGGILAFMEGPISDGWRIRYYECWPWEDGPGTSIGGFDLQGVAAHEYGHALGLGHSGVGGSTMWPSVGQGDVGNRSIAPDDIAGVQAIYGSAAAGKPRITDVTVNGSTVTITGQDFPTSGGYVWFTQSASGGSGQPIKANAGASDGTVITVTVPSAAGPGDILVRANGTGHADLSNAWPADVMGDPCFPPMSYCIAAPNSVGAGMTMSHAGSIRVSQANLVLLASSGPPGQSGVFYYGPDQVQLPFGDGFRCVGPGSIGTFRFPVRTIGAGGTASHAIDWGSPPVNGGPGQLQAGDTWNFQFWYRDPQGGPAGFNFSDGLEITFCP